MPAIVPYELDQDLTDQEQLFIDNYIANGCNASLAWRQTHPGLTTNADNRRGYIMVQRLRRHIDQQLEKYTLTAQEVMALHTDIVMNGNIASVLNDEGEVDIEKLVKSGLGRLVKSMTMRKAKGGGREIRIEMYDRQRSLDAIGRAWGLDKRVIWHNNTSKLMEVMKELGQAPWTVQDDVVDGQAEAID